MPFDSSQTAVVLGSGSWGTALAMVLSEHFSKVTLIGRNMLSSAQKSTDFTPTQTTCRALIYRKTSKLQSIIRMQSVPRSSSLFCPLQLLALPQLSLPQLGYLPMSLWFRAPKVLNEAQVSA